MFAVSQQAAAGPRTVFDNMLPSERAEFDRQANTRRGDRSVATVDDNVRAARCLIPVSVYPPGFPALSLCLTGIIDTGCTTTAITAQVAQFVNLPKFSQNVVSAPGGPNQIVPTYLATLEMWKPGYDMSSACVFGPLQISTMLSPVAGIHLLLGMDIIQNARFEISADGRWTLTL